jgi:hypothetical protein
MDCRSFRKRHLAYLDDTLPGVEMAGMQQHILRCDRCARHDASVRRSLLLLRNLPPIRPTDGFSDRLRARLLAEAASEQKPANLVRGPSLGVFAGVASCVVGLGVLSVLVIGPDAPPRLPAVLASPPAFSTTSNEDVSASAPAFVASMSTGMPVWSALLLAEEGSLRFADAEMEPARWSPPRSRQ